ncbi:hypothetical protein P152DRAFT_462264 [Eremomyces bilateralis CBS 781.70]|uniref:Uncharacterized protein n=1 Tax=Eremomyces bilateralis CBS 781.70 TaxID=1392243 RepID=A0A6G1FSD6_9PEZI|nr:uncharacterized protein P152DRAFT_462264 [Eremomyces bilateralis CBS 781.70]KAF1808697.1 hypothetical protein P152DRAFT_462264 [Eremomyces bilateralis CBS 781.70]
MTMEAPHGTKRRGDNSIEDEQRFVKRFNLLDIDPNSKLYIPASADGVRQNDVSPNNLSPKKPTRSRPDDDRMQVEDTKHKVYIYDLDAELAEPEPEPDEDRRIFIPDIEKHLSKLPRHLLKGAELQSNANNQLIPYTIPRSLSVPQETDSVRKAILEARRRIHEEQAKKEEAASNDMAPQDLGTSSQAEQAEQAGDDPDAMDLD